MAGLCINHFGSDNHREQALIDREGQYEFGMPVSLLEQALCADDQRNVPGRTKQAREILGIALF